jgi:hypothetical protein
VTHSSISRPRKAHHGDYQSDTWYLAGQLTGEASGRHFAFIVIFNRNRPVPDVVADFYTLALFDVDQATYGTFTDYDMPPKNMEPGARPKLTSAEGYLDLRYDSSAGTTTWTACRDSAGELMPYTYDFAAVGRDHGRRNGTAVAGDAHTSSGAGRRINVQRQDRRLSPGRHLFLLSDRHADGGNAALG